MQNQEDNIYYLEKEDIYEYIKNRPPLLMINEAYVEIGKKAYTSRYMREDEWFFECHFPGDPMMPGVLQLETIFNTAALAIKLIPGNKDKTTNISQINSVKYKRHILPNDTITVHTEVLKFRRGLATIKGTISVGEDVCCEVEFILVVLDDMIHI